LVEEVVVTGGGLDASEKKIDTTNFVLTLPEVAREIGQNRRISTGVGELDRVLGLGTDGKVSGMVPGGVTLIGGEPGIGKSTLLTQLVLQRLYASSKDSAPILYVCGEENPKQVVDRVQRLSKSSKGGQLSAAISKN